MGLRLALRGPQRLADGVMDKTVGEGRIVIGRAPDVDWVLPDAQRVISKSHCTVERRADGYHLTDTSTNGVLVNGMPVGHGRSRRLAPGDVLSIGDLVVDVTIGPDDVAEPAMPAVAAPGPAAGPVVGAFMEGPFGGEPPPPGPSAPHKVAVVESAQPALGKAAVMQDWFIPNAGPKQVVAVEPTDLAEAAPGFSGPVGVSAGPAGAPISANLAAAVEGLDAAAVARAVEAAVLVLSEGERERFLRQVRALLGKEHAG